jgi:hypothetical protein
MRHWLIYIDGEPAGLLTLRAEPDGEIEIVSSVWCPTDKGTVSEGRRSRWRSTSRGLPSEVRCRECGCIRTTSTIQRPA